MMMRHVIGTAAGVVVVMGLGLPALGQRAVNQSGRALDANPRVGSGGGNSREGQVDYRVRNDIVTGNVVGGQGLRIDVPYRAANEFGDQLGSDDLFRFRAQSYQSSPQVLRGAAPSVNLGGTSIYGSFSDVPRYQLEQAAVSRTTRIAPRGGTFSADQLAGASLLTGGVTGVERGIIINRPDQRLELTVSPLLGVRQQVQPLEELPTQRLAPRPRRETAPAPLAPIERDPLEADPAASERERLQAHGDDARVDARLDLQPYDPALFEARDLLPGQDDSAQRSDGSKSMSATPMLGRQLQARLGQRLEGHRVGEPSPIIQRQMNRLGQSLNNRAAREAQRNADSPYSRVLGAFQDGGQGDAAGASGQTQALPTPSAEEIDQAEQARLDALRRTYGLPDPDGAAGETPASPQPGPAAGERPNDGEVAIEGSDSAFMQLLERLDYNLPPLQSLAGEQRTQANILMKQAETQLQDAQYFKAERLYRQALMQEPGNPMAQVGLVHAQLGAGLIRSAAINLRTLFEQHPEMIAARYDANLLPDTDRLRWIQGELADAMQAGQAGADPGLMMAYLGYQVNSPQLVRYGLAVAESRAPRDPLMPVLRRIWLGPEQADSDPSPDSADDPNNDSPR